MAQIFPPFYKGKDKIKLDKDLGTICPRVGEETILMGILFVKTHAENGRPPGLASGVGTVPKFFILFEKQDAISIRVKGDFNFKSEARKPYHFYFFLMILARFY